MLPRLELAHATHIHMSVTVTYLEYGRKLLLHVKETVWLLYAVYKSTPSNEVSTPYGLGRSLTKLTPNSI